MNSQGKIKTGLFEGLPAREYFAAEGLNQSTLKGYQECAMKGRALELSRATERKPSQALVLGSALHASILEPDVYASEFVVGPKVDRRTKAGKLEFKVFEEASKGKTIVDALTADAVEEMSKSVEAHPIAAELLSGEGANELSIFWRSKLEGSAGQLCKARLDRLTSFEGVPAVVDLKTTRDSASPDSFAKTCAKFGYAVQAAWYLEGLETLFPASRRFIFIVVESTPPHCVSVCELSYPSLMDGRTKAEAWARRYVNAQQTQVFAGFDDDIQTIETPLWSREKEPLNVW